MPTQERLRSRGAARSRRVLADLATEIRTRRLESGLSQDELGRMSGLSGDKIWKLEHELLPSLAISDACLVASVLGLDFAARLYPNGARIRDAGQSPQLAKLLSAVSAPLQFRTDVPLPRLGELPELRAWDVLVTGHGERTGIEFESRITDFQATTRRHNQKRADDPVDHFLLVLANTRHNRILMADLSPLLADLPRLRTANVFNCLSAGRHPPSGWIFL